MRASKSWGKWRAACVVSVCVLAFGASAFGQVMEWIPVSSTGPASISGNEITLATGGVRVQFDMFISGWSNAPGAPTLGAYQATAVGPDMLGANASPPNPGVNLTHQAQVACASASDCATGDCGSFEPGFCDDNQPAFQLASVCLGTADPCSISGQCGEGSFCIPSPDFVFSDCQPINVVALPANGNYQLIGVCQGTPVVDPGVARYAGSTNFEVPVDAKGTYTITFNPNPELTLLNDGRGVMLQGLTKVSGLLTIEIGCCCYGMGSGQPNCIDNVLESECDERPSPRFWEAGDSVVCCVSDDVGGTVCADDCDGDGILNIDETLLADQDCNGNGLCNSDEIRSCPVFDSRCADCNVTGLPDSCDIDSGTSADCDSDDIPDECTDKGDLNADGLVNIEDVPQFVECLDGPELATTVACVAADFDGDCDVDLEDVAEFYAAF